MNELKMLKDLEPYILSDRPIPIWKKFKWAPLVGEEARKHLDMGDAYFRLVLYASWLLIAGMMLYGYIVYR